MRRRLALLTLLVGLGAILLFGCEGEDKEESEPGADFFMVHFESTAEIEGLGGSIVGSPQFERGIDGNGLYLSATSSVALPTARYFDPKGGCLEVWFQPRRNWNDYEPYRLLSIGAGEDFVLFKESYRNDIVWLVGGVFVFYEEPNTFGEHPEFVWGAAWHQITMCWLNLGTDEASATLYVDGVPRAQVAGFIAEPEVEGDPLIVGAADADSPRAVVDELVLFKRVLSSDDVMARYFSTVPELASKPPVYPTLKPLGAFRQAGLEVSEGFTFAVPGSWIEQGSDAVQMVIDRFGEVHGFEPRIVAAGEFEPEDSFAVVTWPKQPLYEVFKDDWSIGVDAGNLMSEGYWLDVRPEGVAILGASERGAYYGLTTLLQLLSLYGKAQLPALSIVDYPDFQVRGVHIFAEPLTDDMKSLIRFLSALKLNYVVVESAGFYRLEEDEAWRAELLELFDFIRDHQMEPVPELQSYGHAIHIIQICQERFGIDCSEAGSNSYCPCEPTVYDGVVFPAIDQTIQYFKPKVIHFGHDEVMTMNEDPRCDSWNMSNAELFAYDMNKIYDYTKSVDDSVELWIWADMLSPVHTGLVMGTSDALGMVPNDILLLSWTYSNSLGFTYLHGFMSFEAFSGKGFSYIGCPGENAYIGAVEWARITSEMSGLGLLDAIWTRLPPTERWLALPVAAELAWSYSVFSGIDELAYDWVSLTYELGGW